MHAKPDLRVGISACVIAGSVIAGSGSVITNAIRLKNVDHFFGGDTILPFTHLEPSGRIAIPPMRTVPPSGTFTTVLVVVVARTGNWIVTDWGAFQRP